MGDTIVVFDQSNALLIAALRCDNSAESLPGLGRVKTRTRCGAVELRSQASDVLPSRARLRLCTPADAAAQKSRKVRGSYASGARVTSWLSCYYVSNRG